MARTRSQALARQEAGLPVTPHQALPMSKAKQRSKARKQRGSGEAEASQQKITRTSELSEPPASEALSIGSSSESLNATIREAPTIVQSLEPIIETATKAVSPSDSNSPTNSTAEQGSSCSKKHKAAEPLEQPPTASKRRRLEREAGEYQAKSQEPGSLSAYRVDRENYDDNGNLILGGRRDLDADDNDFGPFLPLESEPVGLQGSSGLELTAPARTPTRGWRLTNLLGSVTRFVPGLRRQLHTIPEAPTELTVQLSQPITQPGKGLLRQKKVSLLTRAQRKALKERRRARKEEEARVDERRKAEAERIERLIAEEVERQVKERLKARKAAEPAERGKKRKRYSPDTIPNPKGSSYGMDINFFGESSSSDEDEAGTPDDSPSLRATKRPRTELTTPSYSHDEVFGDPHRARPYVGIYFRGLTPTRQGHTPIIQAHHRGAMSTAKSQPTKKVTFSVPDDSSDEDEPAAPPPRQTPSHITLSSENRHHTLTSSNNTALERAGPQAPRNTSNLRSCLKKTIRPSSSAVASYGSDVSDIPATTNATSTIIPAAATVEAPSQTPAQASLGDVTGNSIAKLDVGSYITQLRNDELINFDCYDPAGQYSTTDSKILALLDTTCTPAVMERNRQMIEADMTQWIAATAPRGI